MEGLISRLHLDLHKCEYYKCNLCTSVSHSIFFLLQFPYMQNRLTVKETDSRVRLLEFKPQLVTY